MKRIFEIFGIMVNEFLEEVRKELGKISIFLQIMIPCFLAYYLDNFFDMVIISCVFVVICCFLKRLHKDFNYISKSGVPVPSHKMVERDRNGIIRLKENNIEKTILYLSDLEKYFERNGIKTVDKDKKI